MLVRPRKGIHLIYLGLCNVAAENAAYSLATRMHMKHHLCSFFTIHAKKAFKHLYDKLHRCVVIVEQQNLIHTRRPNLRFGFLYGQTTIAVSWSVFLRHWQTRIDVKAIAALILITAAT